MNIEKVDESNGVLKARLEDVDEAVANALRRSMVGKVPTLAVKHIEVTKNETGLFDEVLANRIGQVPFNIPQNVSGEDEVHIAVKQEGPGKVYAEDIQADNDEAEPVQPETEIAKLKEDKELELEGIAVLGQGNEHAKHQGGTVGYEKEEEGTYLFRIESTSGYTNEELLESAVEQVLNELDEFEEALEQLH
jgi:DNA-directed RNA polymerase subunit D